MVSWWRGSTNNNKKNCSTTSIGIPFGKTFEPPIRLRWRLPVTSFGVRIRFTNLRIPFPRALNSFTGEDFRRPSSLSKPNCNATLKSISPMFGGGWVLLMLKTMKTKRTLVSLFLCGYSVPLLTSSFISHPPRAIACLLNSVTADPENLEALLDIGVSYTNELVAVQALNYLLSWLRQHPDYQDIPDQYPANPEEDGFYSFHKRVSSMFHRYLILLLFSLSLSLSPLWWCPSAFVPTTSPTYFSLFSFLLFFLQTLFLFFFFSFFI
jgi:hypothetical protein